MARRSRTQRATVAAASWYDSPWRIALHAILVAIGAALAVMIVAIFIVPRLLGGTSLTVLTGSMEPSLEPGDVVVVRGIDPSEVCTDVQIGDIVSYLPLPDDPALITHRVVGMTIGTFDDGSDCRLITQGDNNSAPDEPVSPEQVRGVFLYGVPQLGWLRQWVADNEVSLVIGAVAVVGALLLWDSLRPRRTRVILPVGTGAGEPDETPEPAAQDRELRLRELALREREVAVREAELALWLGHTPAFPDAAAAPHDAGVHPGPETPTNSESQEVRS